MSECSTRGEEAMEIHRDIKKLKQLIARAAYDLEHHTKGSGVKLTAARKFKEPRPEKQTFIHFTRPAIGKEFKKNAHLVYSYLENLTEE